MAADTRTVTQTTDRAARESTLLLQFPQSSDLLNRLAGILERFKDWNDILSKELLKWGSNTLVLMASCESVNIEQFNSLAQKHLVALEDEILVDFLTKQPLEAPVLDGEWTWDISVLKNYASCGSNQSPFSGQPIAVKTHEFARHMINWLKDVRCISGQKNFIIQRESIKSSLMALAADTIPHEIRIMLWNALAGKVRAVYREKIMREVMEQEAIRFAETAQQMREMFVQEKERLEQRSKESEEVIRGKIEQLDEVHQERVTAIKDQLNALQNMHAEDEVRIREANVALSEKGREIRDLLEKQQEQLRRIHVLENHSCDGGCILL